MPFPLRNLGRVFNASRTPDKAAIVDLLDPAHPRTVSYRELDAACDAVARGLPEGSERRRSRKGSGCCCATRMASMS